MRIAVVASVLLAVLPLLADPPAPPAKPVAQKIKRLATANDALLLAKADLLRLRESDRQFIRYFWVQDGSEDAARLTSFTINTVSRATTIVRPPPVAHEHVLLVRIDLRHYAPKINDLSEWLQLWEELQFDPALNLLITKGTLRFAVLAFPDWRGTGWVCRWDRRLLDVEPYTASDGKTYTKRWGPLQRIVGKESIVLKDAKNIDLIRIPGQHVDPALQAEVSNLTGSQAPVVSDKYALVRLLSTIKDKGIYEIIYGGLYYQFAGIRKAAKKKGTDEDFLLEQLGVGNVDQGITADKIFEQLRSDQRVAIFRSLVTGSPRRMDFFRTLAGRLDFSSGLISITHDLRNQDIDIDQHPIANLLDFKDFAREVIWERPNGMHGYALFNGQGVLQDEVPPDIAKDHTISPPHTARLQSAISCIACHEAEGSDGWKQATNDVKKLVAAKGRLDIFADLSRLNDPVTDTLDRLAGLYSGDPERALQRGRDDYAAAVLKATGPWKQSVKGQADVVKIAAAALVKRYRNHFYDTVTPEQALAEIGIVVDPKDASKVMELVLQPDKRAAVKVAEAGDVIIPEDPRLAALPVIPIGRFDWDLTLAFAAERAQRVLATLPKGK